MRRRRRGVVPPLARLVHRQRCDDRRRRRLPSRPGRSRLARRRDRLVDAAGGVTPTVPMGRVSAVPIRVGLSWLVVMPLVGVALFAGIEVERGALVARVVVASVGTIALFTSVLAHEVGHAAVAVRVGVRPRRIVLFLFGGDTG